LGADPIFQSSRSREFFDTDLPAKGILAVYVVVNNETSDSTFLVARECFSLRGGTNVDDRSAPRSTAPGTVITWAGAVLISLPIALIGGGIVVEADNIQINYRRKALQAQSVAPGQSTSGFLYFQVPQDPKQRPRRWILHLEAKPLTSSQPWTVDATFPDGKDLP
jgi:hypothetical protein